MNKADAGTSFIYWRKGYQPQGFDSWAHSQMGRALVALYQGTGDKRVLDALVKVYAAYPENMGGVGFGDVTGLCNLDAMLETYSFSGDRRILDRALHAIAQPAVAKEFQAWAAGQLVPGHMVILYENTRLPAIVYPWTGNEHLLRATLGAWKWLDDQHMLPYGVASGEEFASGIGAFRKTETCDVTAMLLAASWLYRIQGDSDWGDRMERAFFNAGAAPIARDFQTMCYYQSPNRLRADSLPAEQPNCPGPEGIRFHRLGCPQVLCCVGAVNRIIPNYILHMWMATRDNGLAATLYGPCTVSALAGDGVPVKISTTTDYPFGETIRLKVEPASAMAFPLYLRIPGWCQNARITVNGSPVTVTPDGKGFAKLARTWAKGDVVELLLPMEPQVVRGYQTEFPSTNRKYFSFEPAAVFQPRRLPYASVLYGPLLFSRPIPDVDPNTPVKDAKWQYALDTEARQHDAGITVERKPMPAHWDWCGWQKPRHETKWLILLDLSPSSSAMFAIVSALLRYLLSWLRPNHELALENLALRHQIAVLNRSAHKPRLQGKDRLFWVVLKGWWPNWRAALIIVQPETVIGWQRAGFRIFWRWKSRQRGGRPRKDSALIELIRRMWAVNPTWGSPRIRDELAKLGLEASTATIRKYRPKSRRLPSQSWRTFLQNHKGALAAMDFFVVPTATFRPFYVLVVMNHERRKLVHFNITDAPTAAWTTQQIINAFPDDTAPKYLLRDRDSIYGSVFVQRVEGMGIKQKLISPRSPWQNPYVERLVGSIRRECLDRVIVFNARQLRLVLESYFQYYHEVRPHRSLSHDSPIPRPVASPDRGDVIEIPLVGGLHHHYLREAA